jgi:nicotinamidase-related amidase
MKGASMIFVPINKTILFFFSFGLIITFITFESRASDGSDSNRKSTLRIPARYYQFAQLYGPGMPPSGEEGLHTTAIEVPTSEVGLVIVHPWNLGEPDGPYPFEPGTRKPGEVGDWVPRAHEIVANKIKPVLEMARKTGIRVFHLGQFVYADRYPQYVKIKDDPALQPQMPEFNVFEDPSFELCVKPWTLDDVWKKQYGEQWPGPVWQLNGLCRRNNIHTLIYVGFSADLCLVHISGAIKEMTFKFQYRCIVLRDCTTAHEYPETEDGNWMTFAAIRMIETEMGYSATAQDFIKGCEQAKK